MCLPRPRGLLLIAEAALGVSAEDLTRVAQLNLAASALAAPAAEFGRVEFYPEFPIKAAVLCSHLIRNHPLPMGTSGSGSCARWSSRRFGSA